MLLVIYRNSHNNVRTVSWPVHLCQVYSHTWNDGFCIETVWRALIVVLGYLFNCGPRCQWNGKSFDMHPAFILFEPTMANCISACMCPLIKIIHIFVLMDRVSIGSHNLLSIQTLGTNLSEIRIKIQSFWFMQIYLKMSSAKWRQSCPSFSVLNVIFPHPYT